MLAQISEMNVNSGIICVLMPIVWCIITVTAVRYMILHNVTTRTLQWDTHAG